LAKLHLTRSAAEIDTARRRPLKLEEQKVETDRPTANATLGDV